MPENEPEIGNQTSHRPLTWGEVSDVIFVRIDKSNIISENSYFKKQLNPFTSWQEIKTLVADYKVEAECVDELVKLAQKNGGNHKAGVQLLALAAKNRAELLSEKADFYPVGITLFAAIFAALLIISLSSPIVKFGLALGAVGLTLLFAHVRFTTRSQVASLKIIANVLDAVEKRL